MNFDLERLCRIVKHLEEIASSGGRKELLDSVEEKAKAGQFLLKEMSGLERRSDTWNVLKTVTDQLLLPNSIAVFPPKYMDVIISQPLSYFGNINDKLIEIARKEGDPTAIDSETERNEATTALVSAKRYVIEDETECIDNSLIDLALHSYNRIEPFRYFPIRTKNFIDFFSPSHRESLFIATTDQSTFIYLTSHSTCVKGGRNEDACMGRAIDVNTISKESLDLQAGPLRAATSPDEERQILFDIVQKFAGFPSAEDCVQQAGAVASILWLIDSFGYLKFHRFDPAICREVESKAFRHFATGVIEKDTGTMWMIDTWAPRRKADRIIMPKSEWIKTQF